MGSIGSLLAAGGRGARGQRIDELTRDAVPHRDAAAGAPTVGGSVDAPSYALLRC
ncbi:MAG TPA: hypothetical protein VGG50_11680 [Streptosporangiaceae bacterium]